MSVSARRIALQSPLRYLSPLMSSPDDLAPDVKVGLQVGDSSFSQMQQQNGTADFASQVHKLDHAIALESTSLLSSFPRVLAVAHHQKSVASNAQNAAAYEVIKCLHIALHNAKQRNSSLERQLKTLHLGNKKTQAENAQLKAALERVAAISIIRIAINNHATKLRTQPHQRRAGYNTQHSTVMHQGVLPGPQRLGAKNQILGNPRKTICKVANTVLDPKQHFYPMMAKRLAQRELHDVAADKSSIKKSRSFDSVNALPMVKSSNSMAYSMRDYTCLQVKTTPRVPPTPSENDVINTQDAPRVKQVSRVAQATVRPEAMAAYRRQKRELDVISSSNKSSFAATTEFIIGMERHPTPRALRSPYQDHEPQRLEHSAPRTLTSL